MTNKEKADRYDSLMVAFKHTEKMYRNRKRESLGYMCDSHGVILGYHRGRADAYDEFIELVERWQR